MTHRDQYERHLAEKARWAVDLRHRLYETYTELAEQASKRREFEAASAFQYAAQLALGMQIRVDSEPTQHNGGQRAK